MSRTYTVKAGDTLGAISIKYYGVFAKWTKIRDANTQLVGRKPVVDGSPVIFPGDVLIIPGEEAPEIKTLPAETMQMDKNAPCDVSILINGKAFTGFSGYTIKMSVDAFDAFSFTAPYDESSKELAAAFTPFSYADCAVYYEGKILFNGTLLTPSPEVVSDERKITLQGYPRCGVINDVCLSEAKYPPEFNGLKLSEIAQNCLSPYSFGFEVRGDEGGAFNKVEYSDGETLFSFFKKLAEQRGFLMTNKKNGDLLFWKPTVLEAADTLREGETPFVSCAAKFDSQKFFSHITGFSKTTSTSEAGKYTWQNKYLVKKGVFRPLSFVASDAESGDLQGAVEAKAGRMLAGCVSYDLVVSGHKTRAGALWAANMALAVKSAGAMLPAETKMCIDSVDLIRSDTEGNRATLHLVLPCSRTGEVPERMPWET